MNEGKIIEQLTKENEQLKHDIELLKPPFRINDPISKHFL